MQDNSGFVKTTKSKKARPYTEEGKTPEKAKKWKRTDKRQASEG